MVVEPCVCLFLHTRSPICCRLFISLRLQHDDSHIFFFMSVKISEHVHDFQHDFLHIFFL